MTSPFQEYLLGPTSARMRLDKAHSSDSRPSLRECRDLLMWASHGVFTYHANRILKNAQIIAIEADPERFAILKSNAEKWSAESSNKILCINAAASDERDREASQKPLSLDRDQISGGMFSVEERSDHYAPIRVPLICVDDFLDATARTFVKIDVEGAELRVLNGARKHIAAGRTTFFTEISWWGDRGRGTNALDVLRFAYLTGLRVDRRLRSDYLMSPEKNGASRLFSIIRCLAPLLIRVAWGHAVPASVRSWRERRLNKKRVARFDPASKQNDIQELLSISKTISPRCAYGLSDSSSGGSACCRSPPIMPAGTSLTSWRATFVAMKRMKS